MDSPPCSSRLCLPMLTRASCLCSCSRRARPHGPTAPGPREQAPETQRGHRLCERVGAVVWHQPQMRKHRQLTLALTWQLRGLLQQQEKQRGTVRIPCPAAARAAIRRSRNPPAPETHPLARGGSHGPERNGATLAAPHAAWVPTRGLCCGGASVRAHGRRFRSPLATQVSGRGRRRAGQAAGGAAGVGLRAGSTPSLYCTLRGV